MRRVAMVVALIMFASLVLAACGKKDAAGIVKELDKTVSKMESYHGVGTMTLSTGQEPQVYNVEVCYQAPDFYRIALSNEGKDVTQIVLRNKEGVFVLTPQLKKSFRFQSDWPENQGQVYLYQTLAQSIVMDEKRQYNELKDAYVFDVEANYQNGSLARQKIWLNKSSYAPKRVEVSDDKENVLVTVDFKDFKFNYKFDSNYFDMDRNMTASMNIDQLHDHSGTAAQPADAPKKTDSAASASGTKTDASKTSGTQASGTTKQPAAGTAATGANGASGAAKSTTSAPTTVSEAAGHTDASHSTGKTDAAKGQTSSTTATGTTGTKSGTTVSSDAKAQTGKNEGFGVIEPRYTPTGVARKDVADLKFAGQDAVLLRYGGKSNYTLMEMRPTEKTVSAEFGTIVDLGYTTGVLLGDVKRTLIWTDEGVEYRLSSGDLDAKEMVKIAQSTAAALGK